VTGGVPRFVRSGDYAGSFGHQWHWFREVQIDSLNRMSVSEATLASTTGWADEDYRGRRLLDAGVGAGRFAERAAAKGAEVFGIDLSWRWMRHQNIGRLPARTSEADIFAHGAARSFDLAYSIACFTTRPTRRGLCAWPTVARVAGSPSTSIRATARRTGCRTRRAVTTAAAARCGCWRPARCRSTTSSAAGDRQGVSAGRRARWSRWRWRWLMYVRLVPRCRPYLYPEVSGIPRRFRCRGPARWCA
jgi:SAM-dependent methyltransferase